MDCCNLSKEILERFLREWLSTGAMFLDKGLSIRQVEEWLILGKGVKIAHHAYIVAKELEHECDTPMRKSMSIEPRSAL